LEAKKRITMRSVLTAMAIVMSFGVIVFVLWIGAQQVTAGVMTLGELTQFVLYAVLIAGSIGALSETWGDLQRAAGAMERLVELMQAPPDLVYGNTAVSLEPIAIRIFRSGRCSGIPGCVICVLIPPQFYGRQSPVLCCALKVLGMPSRPIWRW
jgi:ABC-type multidrug transport system fused ATPase/permease subunit